MTAPLLKVDHVSKSFVTRRASLRGARERVVAVDDVSFELGESETIGVVGESGSGKSTLARMIVGLMAPDAGRIEFMGRDLAHLRRKELRQLRSHMQMIFQDPYSSLDPTKTIRKLVEEPFKLHTSLDHHERLDKVRELLTAVSLPAQALERLPSELSGGQRQRVAIARAMALEPRLVIADEAVSSLDVSTQAQVINMLIRLGRERGVSFIFVSHDLRLVRHISDRVAVMYRGKVVEFGAARATYRAPAHPYTQALIAAVPSLDPHRRHMWAAPPTADEIATPAATHVLEAAEPVGCPFAARCPHVMDVCRTVEPPLAARAGAVSQVACHLYPIAVEPADQPSRSQVPVRADHSGGS